MEGAVTEVADRVTELEILFTEQQRLLQELSDVVYRQQQQIDLLGSEVALLKKKLAADPGLVDASAAEKPPHY